jgi:hypothetical protein
VAQLAQVSCVASWALYRQATHGKSGHRLRSVPALTAITARQRIRVGARNRSWHGWEHPANN